MALDGGIREPLLTCSSFARFGFCKKSLSGFFVKENFTYPSRQPPPPPPPYQPTEKYFTYASYFGYLFSLTLSMTSYYLEVTVNYISWSRDFALYLWPYLIERHHIQSTLVISKSKGPSKTVRDIRTSTYQICSIEEKNNLNNQFLQMTM